MNFCCLRCEYETKTKAHLIAHLNSKKICNVSDGKINIDRVILIKQLTEKNYNEKTYNCRWCFKPFNHNSNRCTHSKICKMNPANKELNSDEEDDNEEIEENDVTILTTTLNLKEIEKKFQMLEKKIEILQSAPQIINNNIFNNSNQPSSSTLTTPLASIEETNTNIGERPITSSQRLLVWNKDFDELIASGQCPCCHSIITQQNFEVGHIVAKAMGGSNKLSNLRAVCRKCNARMHCMHMNNYIEEMKEYREIMASKKVN